MLALYRALVVAANNATEHERSDPHFKDVISGLERLEPNTYFAAERVIVRDRVRAWESDVKVLYEFCARHNFAVLVDRVRCLSTFEFSI